MEEHKVFKPDSRTKLPKDTKLVTSMWTMKKNANAPVANNMTIHIVMVLMLIARWCGHIVDVKGAFLPGNFEDGEESYMKVLQRSTSNCI
eukprot:15364909-Ditylum_brightwellii.AAC.1